MIHYIIAVNDIDNDTAVPVRDLELPVSLVTIFSSDRPGLVIDGCVTASNRPREEGMGQYGT